MTDFMGKKIDSMENESSDADKSNEKRKARNQIQKEDRFTNYVFENGDTGKYITIRLFLRHNSLEELKYLSKWVQERLKKNGLLGVVQRNILEQDLKALTCFDNPVKEIVNTRGLTNMVMSNEVSEIKPNMFALGETSTGAYCPDFLSHAYRNFCVAFFGVQGSGKSSLVKSWLQGCIMRKEQVIIFDVHNNEYAPFAERNHIPSIDFSSKHCLNSYQIYIDDENDVCINDISATNATSLCVSEFKKIIEDNNKGDEDSKVLDPKIISLYSVILSDMYKPYIGRKCEDIKDEEWFVVSDIINYIEENRNNKSIKIFKVSSDSLIDDLIIHLLKLKQTFGFFFDRTTNIKFDITKSYRFNLAFLEEMNNEGLRSSYYVLMLSYLGKSLRLNERVNNALAVGKKPLRPYHPLTIVAEETGTLFKNFSIRKQFDVFVRQTRKACASILFIFHTISDIEGGTDEEKELAKSILGMCSCVMIGEIDSNTANGLPLYVKGLSKSDMRSAEKFKVDENDKEQKRQFLACTLDGRKVKFYSKVLPRQKEFFGGGQ